MVRCASSTSTMTLARGHMSASMRVELVNHRDDQAAVVGAQDAAQVVLALGHLDGGDAVGGDVAEELGLQLVAVHQHEHGGLLAALGVAQEPGGDGDHGEGLAAALRVPDQAPALGPGRATRSMTFSTARVWCWRRMTLVSSSSLVRKMM